MGGGGAATLSYGPKNMTCYIGSTCSIKRPREKKTVWGPRVGQTTCDACASFPNPRRLRECGGKTRQGAARLRGAGPAGDRGLLKEPNWAAVRAPWRPRARRLQGQRRRKVLRHLASL